jgi:hypothetical protein
VPAVCTAHERRSALRFAAAIAVLFSLVALPAFACNAGFEEVRIPNGAEPPLVAGVWYPTDAPVSSHALGEVGQTVAPVAPVAGNRQPGFDRAAFHEPFNADVVRFFQLALQTNGR